MRKKAASVPFFVMLFILPYPGTVALRLLCLAAAFVVALALWRRSAVPKLPCKLPIALWTIVAAISLAYAVDPAYSLGEIKNEIGYTMMAFFAFFAVTRDESTLRWSLAAVVVAAAIISAVAVPSALQHGQWPEQAWHGGSGNYATLAVMLLPLIYLLWRLKPNARTLCLLAALSVLLGGFFSSQRVVWPIIGLQFLCLVALLRNRGQIKWSRSVLAASIVGVALAAGALAALTQSSRIVMSGPAVEIGRDVRLRQWPLVVERILQHPLTGAGFGRNAMKLGNADLLPPDAPMFWHAHNLFLNYGLAMGLPGIGALVFVFWCLGLCYWRLYRNADMSLSALGIAGLLLVLAVISRNLTNDLFSRDLSLLFWALNGALLGYGLRRSGASN